MIEQLNEYRRPLMASIEKECLQAFPSNAQASIASVLIARDVFSIPSEEVRAFYNLSNDTMARAGTLAQSYEALSNGEYFEKIAVVSRMEIKETRERMLRALEISLREELKNPQAERDLFHPKADGAGLDQEVSAFDRALAEGMTREAPLPKLPSPGRHLRL